MTPPTTTLAAVEGAVVTIVVELTMSIEEIVHVPLAHVAAAHTTCQPRPQPGANNPPQSKRAHLRACAPATSPNGSVDVTVSARQRAPAPPRERMRARETGSHRKHRNTREGVSKDTWQQ